MFGAILDMKKMLKYILGYFLLISIPIVLITLNHNDKKEHYFKKNIDKEDIAYKIIIDSQMETAKIFFEKFINKKEVFELLKIFKPIYKLLPFIGIDAPDLAKVMVNISLAKGENKVFENKEMRKLS